MSLGTGNWFGPTGDCNCCGDRDPLGPCCGGAYADCVPEGYINFSSMRAVVDIGNSFTFSERFDQGACSGPCLGQNRVRTWEYSLSGLAAANGTYIAKYVTYNPSTFEWEEIDTDRRNVCGVWFFPWVSVAIVETMTETSVWSGGCFADTTTTITGPASAWFAPYLGRFFTSKTTPNPAFMNLFLGHQTNTSHPIVLRCDPGEMATVFQPYTCDVKTTVNVSQYWHIEQTARPVSCSALPDEPVAGGSALQTLFSNTVSNSVPSIIGGPVGIGGNLVNITVDGVEGLAIPPTGTAFVNNGTACDLYYESIEKDIKAYSHTDSRNAPCHPTVPDPLVNTISWPAMRRKHSILLNV